MSLLQRPDNPSPLPQNRLIVVIIIILYNIEYYFYPTFNHLAASSPPKAKMATALTEQVTASLAEFSPKSRLYALTIDGTSAEYASLMVEAFSAEDMVQGIGSRDVIAVSVNAHLPLSELLGKAACLEVSLADGTLAKFSGVINEIAMLGSEGGLARYRLRLVPWLWVKPKSSRAETGRVKRTILPYQR